jgi:Trp operon repressor
MRTKLDSPRLTREIQLVLLRLRAGMIETGQARHELNLLTAMLTATEQSEVAEKLRRIEMVMEGRHD